MGVTDELERLSKLKNEGVLNDEEFSKAKADLLGNTPVEAVPTTHAAPVAKPGLLDPKANAKAAVRILVLLVVLIGGGWFVLRMTVGERAADKVVATVVKSPIDLVDKVVNIPPHLGQESHSKSRTTES